MMIAHLISCELKLVIESGRHGARAPQYYNDELSFGIDWRLPEAFLTPAGERQHYLLGVKRRKYYIGSA